MLATLLSLLPVGASAAAVSSLASSSSGSSTAFLGTSLTSCANEQFTYSCENSTAIKNTCCSPTPYVSLSPESDEEFSEPALPTAAVFSLQLYSGTPTLVWRAKDNICRRIPGPSTACASMLRLTVLAARADPDRYRWPDNCDGSYDSYCDLSRQYDPLPSPNKTSNGTVIKPYTGPSIAKYLEEYNRKDLLDYMKTYWVAQGQPSPDFWAHEFSK